MKGWEALGWITVWGLGYWRDGGRWRRCRWDLGGWRLGGGGMEEVRGQIVQSPLSYIPSPDQALFESWPLPSTLPWLLNTAQHHQSAIGEHHALYTRTHVRTHRCWGLYNVEWIHRRLWLLCANTADNPTLSVRGIIAWYYWCKLKSPGESRCICVFYSLCVCVCACIMSASWVCRQPSLP